jgi:hypothetical protein
VLWRVSPTPVIQLAAAAAPVVAPPPRAARRELPGPLLHREVSPKLPFVNGRVLLVTQWATADAYLAKCGQLMTRPSQKAGAARQPAQLTGR